MVFLYRVVSHRPREGLKLFWGGYHLPREIEKMAIFFQTANLYIDLLLEASMGALPLLSINQGVTFLLQCRYSMPRVGLSRS